MLFDIGLFAQLTNQSDWIGYAEGLSDQKVNLFLQDSSGFIWFATRRGLDRYDGLRFKHYSTKENSPAILSNSIIYGAKFIRKQELFMFGDKGIEILDTENDSILHRVEISQNSSLHYLKRTNGDIWLELRKADSTYILRHHKKLQFDTILSTAGTHRPQQFHFHTDGYLYYIDANKRFIRYHLDSKQTTVLDSSTFQQNRWAHGLRLFPDDQDRIWISDYWWNKGPNLAVWDPKTLRFYFPEVPARRIHKKGKLDSNRFVFIDYYNSSSYVVDTRTLKVEPYQQFNKHTNGIYTDRQKNFWILNDVLGVQKKPNLSEGLFKHYLTKAQIKKATFIGMRDMLELPDGNILLSSNSGLYIHARQEDQILPISFTNLFGRKERPHQAYRLYLDQQNKLLRIFGTRGAFDVGVLDWNNRTINEKRSLLSKKHLLCILDDEHKFWFMSNQDLVPVSDPQLSSPEQAKKWPHVSDNLIAYHFIRTKNKHLWMATDQGLYHYDPNGIYIDRYHTQHPSLPLSSNDVYDVLETKEGSIWIATGSGLHQLHPNQESLTIYTQKDGLLNNTVCSILEDDQGYLWMGTFYGLSRFDPKQESFHNFVEEDGLPSNEFNRSARLKTSDGHLYFGGVNGMISFDPTQLNLRKNQSPLMLTSYATYAKNGEQLKSFENKLSELKTIQLPHNNKFFRFEFALLDFINPQKNTYAWFLEGFEKEWRKPTRQAEAQYNNIPAGKYTFRLKAANYSGVWSDHQIAIEVIIQQAFYKTAWFIGLCILSSVLLIYAWYRYRLQQVLHIERMRNKIARDLHDDIGGALTRLSVQSQLMEARVKEPEVVQNFSTVLIQTISKLRDVVWSIDSGHDKMEDLINRMKDYAYDTLHSKEIAYQFDIQHLNFSKKLTPAFRQNVYLIFKESINNIIRHSDASQVKISLINHSDQKRFELFIEDNGNGDKVQKVGGMGLKSMQQRAKQLGGELQIEPKVKGFTVQLICPSA